MILQRILTTTSIKNLYGEQMRIWILILGVKGLTAHSIFTVCLLQLLYPIQIMTVFSG